MALRAGWEARVKIGKYVSSSAPTMSYFSVRRFRVQGRSPALDVGNTEGKPGNPNAANQAARGFQARVKDQRGATFMLAQATIDETATPFMAPLSLQEGDYVRIEIYPKGDDVTPITLTSAQIENISYEGEVGGLQPITLDGFSDGEYSLG